jgi:hypothetical protein
VSKAKVRTQFPSLPPLLARRMTEEEAFENWRDIWGEIYKWAHVPRDEVQPEHPNYATAWSQVAGFLAYRLLPCFQASRRVKKGGRRLLDPGKGFGLSDDQRKLLILVFLEKSRMSKKAKMSVLDICEDLRKSGWLPKRYRNLTDKRVMRLFYEAKASAEALKRGHCPKNTLARGYRSSDYFPLPKIIEDGLKGAFD